MFDVGFGTHVAKADIDAPMKKMRYGVSARMIAPDRLRQTGPKKQHCRFQGERHDPTDTDRNPPACCSADVCR
jgi:hypothetical protein